MTNRSLPTNERINKKTNWFYLVVLVIVISSFGVFKVSQAKWAGSGYYLMAVVAEEKISVIGLSATESRGYELIIPGNVMVPVVGMQGSLKASSLWQFGRDEGVPERIVEDSLERMLGIKINGVVKTEDDLNWFDIRRTRGGGELVDKLRWVEAWYDLREDQKVRVGIPMSITEQKTNPDGEEVSLVDEAGLQNLISDYWANPQLLDERIGIEVVNASSVEGMGKLAETMIKAAGGLVLKVEADDELEGGCLFSAGEEILDSETVKWMRNQFGCVYDRKREASSGIKVWLGKEWGEKYRRG